MPIDLILHTPGGLVLAAMQIARTVEAHKAKVHCPFPKSLTSTPTRHSEPLPTPFIQQPSSEFIGRRRTIGQRRILPASATWILTLTALLSFLISFKTKRT
jgi:hypothetical protein